MTVRRVSPIWGLLPLMIGLLLMALAVFGSLDLRSFSGLCLLVALPVSTALLFGGFERPYWFVAGGLALVVGGCVALLNAWLTGRLLLADGDPGGGLTDVTAVLILLGTGAALFSATTTAVVCAFGWLRRPRTFPPLP